MKPSKKPQLIVLTLGFLGWVGAAMSQEIRFQFGECCAPVLGGCAIYCDLPQGCTGNMDCGSILRPRPTSQGFLPELGLAASFWAPEDMEGGEGLGFHADVNLTDRLRLRVLTNLQEGLAPEPDRFVDGTSTPDLRLLTLEAGPIFDLWQSDRTQLYAGAGLGFHLLNGADPSSIERAGWFGLLGVQLQTWDRVGFFGEALYRDAGEVSMGDFGDLDLAGTGVRAGLIWRPRSSRPSGPPDILPPQGERPWVYSQQDPTAIHNTNTGHVGIGTLEPSAPLTVVGMIETTQGGVRFPDGTVQSTAQARGERGPKGERGAAGTPGPPGPAVTTFCAKVDGSPSGPGNCSCGQGTEIDKVFSNGTGACSVTSDTGTCTAGGYIFDGGQVNNGSCCVCRP